MRSQCCGPPPWGIEGQRVRTLNVEVWDVPGEGGQRFRKASVPLVREEMDKKMDDVLAVRLRLSADATQRLVWSGGRVESADVWQRWTLRDMWERVGVGQVLTVQLTYDGLAGDDDT